jgi:hypothetical protein
MLEMFSTESFMNEKEVPQSAVVRVRRAKSKSFLLLNEFNEAIPKDLAGLS